MAEEKKSATSTWVVLLPSIVTLLIGIGVGEFVKSYLFPSRSDSMGINASSSATTPAGIKPPATIDRAVYYAKILYFRDKQAGEPHMLEKTISPIGGKTDKPDLKLKLYDEAVYFETFFLNHDHPDRLHLEGHSTGKVDVSPIDPPSFDFFVFSEDNIHKYRLDHKILQYEVDVRGRDHFEIAYHYYNSFQFNDNEGQKQYESDGGFHFYYSVQEAVVYFDFSTITNGESNSMFRLKEPPTLYMKLPGKKEANKLESTFDKRTGILTSKIIQNVDRGTKIYSDWEWETEDEVTKRIQ